MDVNSFLNQLKDILPTENFKIQPDAAREKLLELEKTYLMNTSDFLAHKVSSATISEEIQDQWMNAFETFIQFEGVLEDLNHLSVSNSLTTYPEFINTDTPTKEYLSEKKQGIWLDSLLFYLINNLINLQTVIWMK